MLKNPESPNFIHITIEYLLEPKTFFVLFFKNGFFNGYFQVIICVPNNDVIRKILDEV